MLVKYFFCFVPGQKRVAKKASKLPVHMSIMHMCNAVGTSLPPLYVFAGVNLLHNMLEGAPDGK